MAITYKQAEQNVKVYLDGALVGTIKNYGMIGFVYVPKGSRTGGSPFKTLAEVKRSLEN